jgi:hypothetical protein
MGATVVSGDLDTTVLTGRARATLDGVFADPTLGRGLYLGGGTGLALQIGHRLFDGLDLFTLDPAPAMPPTIQRRIGRLSGRVLLRERGQIDLDISGTRVSFIAYPFPLLTDVRRSGALRLASTGEIALMKAYALSRRITGRDYIDLYFLLRDGHTTLDRIRRDADAKFRIDGERLFGYVGFLRQLADSSDVDDWPEALSLVRNPEVTKSVIEEYFALLVRERNGIE